MRTNEKLPHRYRTARGFHYQTMVRVDEWAHLGRICQAERVLREIIEFYGVSLKQIISRDRFTSVVWCRQVFCYLSLKHTRLSHKSIGGYINRDHATVIHSKRVVENLIETDAQSRYDLRLIEAKLISV